MTRQQADDSLSTPLSKGFWTVLPCPQASLYDVLGWAAAGGAEVQAWQGIAYTTAGAHRLYKVQQAALLGKDNRAVQAETVYELRLWLTGIGSHQDAPDGTGLPSSTDDSPEDTRSLDGPGRLLARELRWLNGSGATEVTVYADSASATAQRTEGTREPCWLRENTYLQHGADPSSADGAMTSIEVFVAEPEYSNTVFVDELMTGRWI